VKVPGHAAPGHAVDAGEGAPDPQRAPSLAMAQTSPLTLGANEETTPVVALKATILPRAKVPPG
jgi:hypothetical protein